MNSNDERNNFTNDELSDSEKEMLRLYEEEALADDFVNDEALFYNIYK
jgi:hypothetical protein